MWCKKLEILSNEQMFNMMATFQNRPSLDAQRRCLYPFFKLIVVPIKCDNYLRCNIYPSKYRVYGDGLTNYYVDIKCSNIQN